MKKIPQLYAEADHHIHQTTSALLMLGESAKAASEALFALANAGEGCGEFAEVMLAIGEAAENFGEEMKKVVTK